MKRLLILLMIICFIITAHAQKTITKNDVPPKVMEKILQIRPHIKSEKIAAVVKWQKDGIYYKVLVPGIRGEKFPTVTVVDSAGNFIYMEDFIEPETLPMNAREYIWGQDPGAIISEAYRIQDTTYTFKFRAVVISKPIFDRDGNLISPKKKK